MNPPKLLPPFSYVSESEFAKFRLYSGFCIGRGLIILYDIEIEWCGLEFALRPALCLFSGSESSLYTHLSFIYLSLPPLPPLPQFLKCGDKGHLDTDIE